MSIETAVLAVVVFGAAALAIFISFVLAKCEDEARRMVKDAHQLHYGDETECGRRTAQDEWACADQPLEEPHDHRRRCLRSPKKRVERAPLRHVEGESAVASDMHLSLGTSGFCVGDGCAFSHIN